MGSSPVRRRLLIGGAIAALLVLAAAGIFAAATWNEINRVSIDRPDVDAGGPEASEEDPDAEEQPEDFEPRPVEGRQIFLLVGSDSREDLEDTEGFGEFEGTRADVVMVLLKDGDQTGILSLPRDLLIDNPCGGGEDRLGEMLQGCDRINGATLLVMAVEEMIGRSVDHFALVDLEGFQGAVDAVGGYEICVENAVRDQRAKLELDEGCTLADGEQTLAWMRSRHTEELTADGWSVMPGVNDLARNERQRAFLIDMMGRIADVTNPQDMVSAAQAVAPFVTVDSQLSLMDAVNLALTLRGLRSGGLEEIEVPVYDATSEGGAAVLLPSTPVEEIVAEFLSAAAADGGVMFGIDG